MSVGHCWRCFAKGAYPLEIALASVEVNGGVKRTAEWLLDAYTWKNDQYVTIREAVND